MRLKNGVQIQHRYAQPGQIWQLAADAFKIAAEIIARQVAVLLLGGPEIRLAAFVFPVDAVCKRHGLWAALEKAVWKYLIHHAALYGLRRGKPGLVHRKLVLFACARGDIGLAKGAAVQLAVAGVKVKIVKIQPRLRHGQGDGEQIAAICPARTVQHKRGWRLAIPVQHKAGGGAAEFGRHPQRECDGLPGAHSAKGGFVEGVTAVVDRAHRMFSPR